MTYTCARCDYRSANPEEFRRVGWSLFNECTDRMACDLRTATSQNRKDRKDSP